MQDSVGYRRRRKIGEGFLVLKCASVIVTAAVAIQAPQHCAYLLDWHLAENGPAG